MRFYTCFPKWLMPGFGHTKIPKNFVTGVLISPVVVLD